MNGEFEKKLESLRKQLEEHRQNQVTTMKNVLERQRSDDLCDMEDVHQRDLEELRNGRQRSSDIQRLLRTFAASQVRSSEDKSARKCVRVLV